MSRLTRDRAKRAVKQRQQMHEHQKSIEGATCPACEPHVNGVLRRETHRAHEHVREINEALSR